MNLVILKGRLTRDVETRYSQGATPMATSKYCLAIDRKFKREGEPSADFINCVAFGKQGEFAEKYLRQGMAVLVKGRILTGSYTNKDGKKVYTTDVVVEEHEFCESKGTSQSNNSTQNVQAGKSPFGSSDNEGFMNIPDNIAEEVPFFN